MRTKTIKKIGSAILALTMLFCFTFTVNSADFKDFAGNYKGTCKIDPPTDYVIYFDTNGEIAQHETDRFISFDVSDDGKYLSFFAENVLVSSVYVKGGNNYRIYDFDPLVDSASGLCSPLNGGVKIPAISHYGFDKIAVRKPTPTPTKPITATPTPKATITPTITPKPSTTPTTSPIPTVTPTITKNPTPTVSASPTPKIPSPSVTSYNPETGYGEPIVDWVYLILLILIAIITIWIMRKKNL